jgi:hypothetical protein
MVACRQMRSRPCSVPTDHQVRASTPQRRARRREEDLDPRVPGLLLLGQVLSARKRHWLTCGALPLDACGRPAGERAAREETSGVALVRLFDDR